MYENAQVSQDLSLRGIEWAFSHSVNANWHPLTIMSYQLDHQLYGLKAGGYHLTNVLLHGAAAMLLFLTLRRMTAAPWRSAFVAVVFAIHPLHVESVAWVAERKDVLSGVFFMLTLGAYVGYVREPRRLSRYLAVVFFFALGLMSKPMLVTLPLVLLLLDYWPLNRFTTTLNGLKHSYTPGRLILEKIPLFALSAAGCLATLVAQQKVIVSLPFSLSVNNACVACATYLWQMVYPRNLAAYYPFNEQGLPLWEVALSFLLLVFVSTLAFVWRRKRPWLLMGWLWYLVMLVPVLGLVQSGLRAHADRYTYLPQIGLYLIIAWAATELVAGRRYGRLLLGSLASAVIVALIQVSYWKNSVTFWEHTLAVSGDSDLARNNLGLVLVQKGQLDEAIAQYQQALKINPDYDVAHNNLGLALGQKGRLDEAIAQYQQANRDDWTRRLPSINRP
ncbi:MAG: tetratricopeptide repeat protein [Verrucomicrobiota bacterium]